MKKFDKSSRSTFPYWFYHWYAFNKTAKKLGVWRPKYLLHDIEKPWLKLIWDYKKVQTWHRIHNSHHLQYPGKINLVEMAIDWECSGMTKTACPLNARQEWERVKNEYKENGTYDSFMTNHPEMNDFEKTLDMLGI